MNSQFTDWKKIFALCIWQRPYCSASSSTGKQMKTMTLLEVLKKKKKGLSTPNAVKDIKLAKNSHNAGGNKNGRPLQELAWQFLTKLDICTDSIVLPDVQPREMKICINRNPSGRMFTAALFIRGRTENCPDVCPSIRE